MRACRVRRSARAKKPIIKEPIVDESSTESEAELGSETFDSSDEGEPHIELAPPQGPSDTGAGVSAPQGTGVSVMARSKGTLGRLTQEAQQSSGRDLFGKSTGSFVVSLLLPQLVLQRTRATQEPQLCHQADC